MAAPDPDGDGVAGEKLILILFLILAASVVLVFAIFRAFVAAEEVREEIPMLIARNLYLPVVATSILVSIDAARHKRRWWVYFVTAPVPVVNVVLAVLWLAKWRRDGGPMGL